MEHLIEDAEAFVTSYLNNHLNPSFVYHNLAHTQRVVSNLKEIIEETDLSKKEKEQLLMAAWFHDTGFGKTIDGHEAESARIATSFLKEKQIAEKDIQAISKMILATKIDYEPKTKVEGYIRDADSAHLSSKNYDYYTSLLRKEWELTAGMKMSEEDWLKENIDFLNHHSYMSELAIKKWQRQKDENLAKLLKSLEKIQEKHKE
ncbi:HD domain-containing protein [Winogradskyella aurantia]|uniref:HD domain-containing protein n=1 Tax=Winogradskyella aurantia TaxID=1915063 RepID=A0A265UVK4_9FLAO|nr:HD domain-containing protein [Winogradskyella aurantia]OZV69336.1 hypothetical protein CA834_07730 [Winogradskyella aurantia]